MTILKQGAQKVVKRTMEQTEIRKGAQSKWKNPGARRKTEKGEHTEKLKRRRGSKEYKGNS